MSMAKDNAIFNLGKFMGALTNCDEEDMGEILRWADQVFADDRWRHVVFFLISEHNRRDAQKRPRVA